MFDARELNRRVELQEFVEVVDPATGYRTQEWTTYAEVLAKVEPLVGREYFAAKATQAENMVKFTMRWRAGVEPSHRLAFDGKAYGIESVINVKSRNRELLLMARTIE